MHARLALAWERGVALMEVPLPTPPRVKPGEAAPSEPAPVPPVRLLHAWQARRLTPTILHLYSCLCYSCKMVLCSM